MSSSPTTLLPPEPETRTTRGSIFWLSFTAVVVCNFLSALDVTAVSTALPPITNELNGGDEFVWVGSAYGLAAAAILPLTGRLADIMGRRPIMMTCVGFFFMSSQGVGAGVPACCWPVWAAMAELTFSAANAANAMQALSSQCYALCHSLDAVQPRDFWRP